MPSIIPGYNYDIFISYRQKDNKGEQWVSEFVESLKTELEATFKEEISVYFDINPHDGLLETHDVGESLKEKLKCLVFIPIISRTYCDPKSFAWEHEFKAFVEEASKDKLGLKIKLQNSNVASRVLPVQIHEINPDDKAEVEKVLGGIMRPVEFIYKEPGVNRPLRSNEEHPDNNLNKSFYRNQINKVANAIDEILTGLKNFQAASRDEKTIAPKIHQGEESLDEISGTVKKARFSKTKIIPGISFLVLIIISAVIIFLFRPGKGKSIDAMTVPVTIINENGVKEVRRVFKEDYMTRLAIFPFNNQTADSSADWLMNGFLYAIWLDLVQFNYITSHISQANQEATHLQEQINEARKNNYPYFLAGTFRMADGVFKVNSRLYKTSSGSIIKERIFTGRDFFRIADSITLQTRIDIGIPDRILESFTDLPIAEYLTGNFDAYRSFVSGLEMALGPGGLEDMSKNFFKAIEFDSTFALSSYFNAYYNSFFQESLGSARRDIDQAMRHRMKLPEYYNISVRSLYYSINGEYDKAIELSEMQHELKPDDIQLLSDLIDNYESNYIINAKYWKAVEKLIDLAPDDAYYLRIAANSCLLCGEYKRGFEVLKNLLSKNPDDIESLLQMAEIYIHMNNPDAAEKIYRQINLVRPENMNSISKMIDCISYARNNPVNKEFLESFTGDYRFDNGELTVSFFVNNDHLIAKAKNQYPAFNYPVSDSQFVSINGSATFTFSRNDKGKIIKTTLEQNNNINSIAWKEDSLILEAEDLLDKGNNPDALSVYRDAYLKNPDHKYLAGFIKHLEYILDKDYEKEKTVVNACQGKYGTMIIFKINDRFFYQNDAGYIFKLLPVSSDYFISPSFYDRTFRIVRDKNKIKGLEILYRDGKREFLARTDNELQ